MRYKAPSGWTFIDHETLSLWDTSIIAMTGVCYVSDAELKQGHLDGTDELTLESLIERAKAWKFNIDEQVRLGRGVSKSAMQFWKDQPESVREMIIKPKEGDISVLEMFNLLQAYHIQYGTRLDQTRLIDRNNFDITKLQHLYMVTMGNDKSQTKVPLPYNPYATWECSVMFKLFTGCRYAKLKPEDVKCEQFVYHHPAHDAALDAYRFMLTFSGNDSIEG